MIRIGLCVLALLTLSVPVAHAAFPYAPQGHPSDYTSYHLPTGAPNDLDGKRVWMYAATADPNAPASVLGDPRELHGVRGASLADRADVDQAWRTTTGRPDVTIAVLDSGIKWDDRGAMEDIRRKTRLSTGETPLEPGADCARYATRSGRDRNGDGVFNLVDYACDSRVRNDTPLGVGPRDVLDPQDVLIAFSDGTDADGNGYVDDIVGWDFLDDDNDPYDDVQYGHGTGEARDSAGEADNGGDLGTCPNCMEIHLRVGTSFIADVNRFAMAVLYAVDNDVLVVQEALGTLNKSALGEDAVRYAYDHGVAVIASAADEAAQHHNWPSSYPYVIVVNSNTYVSEAGSAGSYLAFNGCTNFSSRITLAVPSVSCSSDATGRGAGMAGILYSAALNAIAKGRLEPHPTCRLTDGRACPLSANEVRQLLISGADDVDFSGGVPELTCRPVPVPACTDPFAAAPGTQGRLTAPRSYPARKGFDQFYGYGRVNMNRSVDAVAAGAVPPEVEVISPGWFDMVDPGRDFVVEGEVFARGRAYGCEVLVAPGSYPSDTADFLKIPSACDGGPRTEPLRGPLATVDVALLRSLFPANAGDFTGREPGLGEQPHSGRPNTEPYGFHVKIVATADGLIGQDRRNAFLHRDGDLLEGFPKQLAGDGEASPALVDVDGDNANELVIANSDGEIHAYERDGGEAAGFPVHTDPLPLHRGQRAFASGEVADAHGAVLATPATVDLDRDGTVEIVVADLEGKVYVIGPGGEREAEMRTSLAYAGVPPAPFRNTRRGRRNRTQLGFIGSPVAADLDADGDLEIVAAAMDRHVYAWHHDGRPVHGWPVLVVDRSKVASIDAETHRVDFKPGIGEDFDQGAIISTPAVGDLTGDGRPEVVVGTNESYEEPLNAGGFEARLYDPLGSALTFANGRLFAIRPEGDRDGDLMTGPWLRGWPFKVGILQAGVLPLVGEGITGAPVIGNLRCGTDTDFEPRVGVIPAAGLPYLVNATGVSCLGRGDRGDIPFPLTGGTASDQPFIAAFGHPAIGRLEGAKSLLAPAAGLQRALDVVLPEYQGGHDYLVAWNPVTGRVSPGWPAEMNDLQFLTGPSVADLDGLPGEEVVAGSASDDLQAFSGAGTDSSAAWPKLTGDWTVANPATGGFGGGRNKVVVALTRSGRVLAYETAAPVCSPASWPRFHHDNANSGDDRRDAVAPGRPSGAAIVARTLSFTAPGDDLLCGPAARFEIRTSDLPITAANFAAATKLAATVAGAAPGANGTALLPLTGLRRYVAIRAVDDQSNVGLPAVVDRG